MLPISPSKECSPPSRSSGCRAAIRTEVPAMDTFFLTDMEVAGCEWGKAYAAQDARTRCRPVATTSLFGDTLRVLLLLSLQLRSSPASCYTSGSSTFVFNSSSADSSELPATPPALRGRGRTYSGQGQSISVSSPRGRSSLADLLIDFHCFTPP